MKSKMRSLSTAQAFLAAAAWAGSVHSASAQSYNSCTEYQVNKIAGAAAVAESLYMAADDELASIDQGGDSSRFEEYFGPATSDRVETVRAMLYASWWGAMGNAAYHCGPTFGCQADPSAYAWSDLGGALGDQKTYGVYFCEPFWDDDWDVYDAATTLMHEYVHLYSYATDPTPEEGSAAGGYDQWCRDLAESDPDATLGQPYCYQYFLDR